MTKQDLKNAIPAVGAIVVLIFSGALLSSLLELRSDYNELNSKSNIMAETIENYSAQLDRNVEVIKEKDIHIKKLEDQIPK